MVFGRARRQAVRPGLQAGGATRRQIAEQFGVSALVVKALLRDGKFYANPRRIHSGSKSAKNAAAAQSRGIARANFCTAMKLTVTKGDERWRDANVLYSGDKPTSDPARGARE